MTEHPKTPLTVGQGQDIHGGFSTRPHAVAKPTPVQERLRLAAQKRARKGKKLRKELHHG